MVELAPFLMLIALFICIAVVIISLSNNRLKKKMIELGHIDENAIQLFKTSSKFKFDSLKWGLILFFAGLGLIIISVLPEAMQFDSSMPFGIELVFIAFGFLVYFFSVRNKRDNLSE